MKLSLNWLRESVALNDSSEAIAQRLTMAGIEATATPLPALGDGIVVGRITDIAPHPDADKLRVCQVDAGEGSLRQIVCGAPNARSGLLAPVALPGAVLPNGMKIGEAKLRGVESAGMLCSASELGLAEKSEGLLPLDDDAPVGTPLAQYLQLDDAIIELELTPNRGDCLGVLGLARELSALYGQPLQMPAAEPIAEAESATVAVEIEDTERCPVYAGRVISGVDPAARTPDWMRERLRRAGLRSISVLVDVTNYVMLELGQPMHAFDAARLKGGVTVRLARAGETLTLLNGQRIELDPRDLLIADASGPLALAGVMGGADSEVGDATTQVFLESACFAPMAVAGTGRRYKLHTDAAYRFERGVDPALQGRALDRATALILALCGGRAGPVTLAGHSRPAAIEVMLRHARLERLLGYTVPAGRIPEMLQSLGVEVASAPEGWRCRVPSYRYDLRIEADLIEEVARLYGYDNIPARPYAAELAPAPLPEARMDPARLRTLLAARGYQEAVTYSFVDPGLQQRLTPDTPALMLDNPIAETMAAMRTTLWTGLLAALQYNLQRQQRRLRLFELGVCFAPAPDGATETQRLAGIALGPVRPEHWDDAERRIDLFDLKGDLDAVLPQPLRAEAGSHPALHPGRCAQLFCGARPVGWLGELHPLLTRELDLPSAPILFELDWAAVSTGALPQRPQVSEYPASRRDLALEVAEAVTAAQLIESAQAAGGALLRRVLVFDVYRGTGLSDGCKSVALGLIFQDYSSTLTDQTVDAAVASVLDRLRKDWGASVRS